MAKEVKSRGKKLILSIAIAILFVMFVAYAIETIYPSPKYDKYCPVADNVPSNLSDCEVVNGTWVPYSTNVPEKPALPENGYCDTFSKCQAPWGSAQEEYNRNVFFICLIIGIIVFAISFVFQVEAVSSGFMAGAVILMVYGTIRYWGALSNIWKTLMIGVVLAVLVFIGYRKLK